MDELISRQAAIDAVEESRRLNHHQDGKEACAHEYEHRHFLKILRDLPSEEPQIIRCKDCKHHWTLKCMDSMPIERCDLEQTFYDAEYDFCSLAERRENG